MSPVLSWIVSLIIFAIVIGVEATLMKRIKGDFNLIVPVIAVLLMTGLFITNVLNIPFFILFIIVSGFFVYNLSDGTVKGFKGFQR
ncbi:hypothetical protein K2V61_10490 [Staphylococcus simulans]|uniref:hypothetical protein n=1 Tax=Staphylococcus simulans TaxID=1286 RepID=UPI001E529A97|nr:hypothetical protein [Staphylococcus simulans]MCD8915973.1 hypothetical protein [Staphylococcus simulans]